MRTVAVLTLIALSSCTGPDEAIDSTEASLARSPDGETTEHDQAYLDELLRRHEDIFGRLAPAVSELPPETMDAILAGEVDEREVLDMNDDEYQALVREIGDLAEENAAVLSGSTEWTLEKKNDGKGPDKVECDENYRLCMATTAATFTSGPWGLVGFILITTYCVCTHCKGGKVDKICGVMR